MIRLEGQDLSDCLAKRERWYANHQKEHKWIPEDLLEAKTYREKVCAKLGINPDDYSFDLKCGIFFTKEEVRQGIKRLHNHGT